MGNMMVMEEASPTFFLQIESGGEKFVEVPSEKIPISTTTIKTTTASKAECETACNKAPLCKGYKHTNGSNQCTLLGHQIAAPGAAAAPAAVDPSIAIAAAAQKAQDEAKKEGKADREKAAAAMKDSEEKKAEAKTEMKAAEDAKAQVEAQASALKQEKKGVRKAEAKAEEKKIE